MDWKMSEINTENYEVLKQVLKEFYNKNWIYGQIIKKVLIFFDKANKILMSNRYTERH